MTPSESVAILRPSGCQICERIVRTWGLDKRCQLHQPGKNAEGVGVREALRLVPLSGLRWARKEAGMTIYELSDLSGISPSHIGALERLGHWARQGTAGALAQALDLAVDDLTEEPWN